MTRDHLDFFHFIGRVIGKAIHDAQNLEARKPNHSRGRGKWRQRWLLLCQAWFTRGFYKHMLGKKAAPHHWQWVLRW